MTAVDSAIPAATPLVFKNLLSTARGGTLGWEPFRDGIEVSWVYCVADGPRSAFLRYAPGARLPRHEHHGYEHVFVLDGSQTDANGEHRAGALLVHPPGSSHAIVSQSGCIALVVWEKPVVFINDVET